MDNSEVNSTAITNDYKRNRIIFIILSVIYTIACVAALFKYGLWGFVVINIVSAPILFFSMKASFILTGHCPLCNNSLALRNTSEDNILKCNTCGQRIIVRDGRFWQHVGGVSSLSGAPDIPPGMTLDDFIERKQWYKKQAWIGGGLIFILLSGFPYLGLWLQGNDKPLEIIKSLDELQTAQGIFTTKRIGSNAGRIPPPLCLVLLDEKSRDVLFTGLLMGDERHSWVQQKNRGEFTGKQARIWYTESRGKERPLPTWPLVYQLEIDGKLIFSLDDANKIARGDNQFTKKILLPFILFVALLFGSLFGYLLLYRGRIKMLFGKEK